MVVMAIVDLNPTSPPAEANLAHGRLMDGALALFSEQAGEAPAVRRTAPAK